MPFIAKNPITSVALNNVPDTPIPGTRSIFPMSDGWYEMDSDGNARRLGADSIETINLTSITNNTITTSNELGSLRDNKIYQLKIGYKTGWLIISGLEEYEKNICQTLIDLDGSIYNRYHSEAGVGEEGWSEWEPYATKSDVDSKISDALDNRGIQIISSDINYNNLTNDGIYLLQKGYADTEYIIVVHSPYSTAEISQYRINSAKGLLKRTYVQNMETGEYSWTDWYKYISTENIDIALSETSTNPVQNKVIKQAIDLKAEQLELERLKYYRDKDIVPSDESYFTVNDTGETITGLTDTGKTQTELVIPYKINGKEITTLYSGVGDGILKSILNGSTTITKITIPKSVTSIGEAAFLGCSSLTSINIPSSVATIGTYVFNSCSSLTSVNIPNSVTSIGKGTFAGCTSLTSVNIPDGVTSIGDYAFQACTSLTSINIPDSVASIGDYAFRGCNSLTSINIPNSVTSIGGSAFGDINPATLIIYCEQGSYAETYANTNNIPVKYTDIDPSKYMTKDTVESTYATKESVIPKISLWKPNTSYEVGNVVIALDPDGYYYTATCKTEHISSDIESLFMGDAHYWTTLQLKVYTSNSAMFADSADQAHQDSHGNNIFETYATKTELRPTPITSTATAITANNSYNYGEQTELSIAFPTTANDGDVIYITFTSGATATVLTLDTTNTSDIELIPEANTGYEIYAKYNGTVWIVNYSDYTVTTEAGV